MSHRPNTLLATIYLLLLTLLTGCSQSNLTADHGIRKSSPENPSAERKVQAQVEGEMPDYTIDREYRKNRQIYSFIQPIESRPGGNFVAHTNLVYRSIDGRDLHLDLFQPTATAAPQPAVLLVHGGGWRTGDRSHQLPMAQALAEAGYVGVAVEYRLSREALYPAGLDDLRAAIHWLRRNSKQFAIDPGRIAILGASSGAHMATLLGATGHLDRFAGESTKDASGNIDSRVQAIINVDGVVDLASEQVRVFEDKPGKVSYAALWLGGRYAQLPELWHEASPLQYVGANTPPTLFINSAQPRFHMGRDEFVAELGRRQTYYEIHTLPDTPHAFWLFHPWFDNSRDILIAFLQRVFKDAPPLQQYQSDALSTQRIQQLPQREQQQWLSYLQASQQMRELDRALLRSEMERPGGDNNSALAAVKIPRDSALARQLKATDHNWLTPLMIQNMLSFQTPSGGWSKGTDIYSNPRQPGQQFGVETHYVPTFDNGATFTQIQQLSHAWQLAPNADIADSLPRAIELLLQAQYPSGGWPQTYPLTGDYHDCNTYNDGVVANATNLLLDILQEPAAYAIDNPALLGRIEAALDNAVQSILADQQFVSVDSGAWGQQHDPLSRELRPARAFEMAALASMESADILRALMRIQSPSADLRRAIHAGANWLQQQRLQGIRWQRNPGHGSKLVQDAQASDLWPRMVDPHSGRAVFGDRDGSIHFDVTQISDERQQLYAWYHSSPAAALQRYRSWQQQQ